MKTKTRNLIDLILNLVIVLSTVWAVNYYYIGGPDALGSVGSGCFRYFTTDSNILVALASTVMLILNAARFFKPDARMPKWVSVFKYAGTAAVALTLVTVVLFLGPFAAIKGGLQGYLRMFEKNILVLHLTTPMLAIISLIFFERDNEFSLGDSLIASMPAYVYGVVYFTLVVCLGVWTDWYNFTLGGKGYMIPVALVVMFLAAFGLSVLLKKLRRK